MGDKSNFKKKFVNIFHQAINICKDSGQEADNCYNKGRNDAFDEVLQWYIKESDNGNKLVTVNQIIMYLQEKLEKTKTQLNKDNDNINNDMSFENSSDMGRLFSFPEFN